MRGNSVCGVRRLDGAFLATLALIVAYAVIFSCFTVLRHRAFGTACYDLGNMDQAVWNTAHGRPLMMTTVPELTTHSRLGAHVEPILLLIAPLYYIHSGPETLLVLQSVVLALGGLYVYRLARLKLRSRWASFGLVCVYLAYPPLQAANDFHFHPVTLAVTFVLAAVYFIETEQYGCYYASIVLAMACKEDIPLIIGILGLYIVVVKRRYLHGLTTLITAFLWFSIAVWIILPAHTGDQLLHVGRYGEFGSTMGEVLVGIAKRPVLALQYIATPQKLAYVLSLLWPLVLFPVFGVELSVLVLPTLAVNLLSSFSSQIAVDVYHYSAPSVPGMILGTIWGVDRLTNWLGRIVPSPRRHRLAFLIGLLMAITTVSLYFRSPLPVFGFSDWPLVGEHERVGHTLLKTIPGDVSVSAQAHLAPHLTNRERIYQYPTVAGAEVIVLDVTRTSVWFPSYAAYYASIDVLLAEGQYGVWQAVDGYIVFRRDHQSRTLPDSFYSFLSVDSPEPEYALDVSFGDGFHLVGYDLGYRAGADIRVTLYFEIDSNRLPNVDVRVVALDHDGTRLQDRETVAKYWMGSAALPSAGTLKLDTWFTGNWPTQDFSLGLWVVGYPPDPSSRTQSDARDSVPVRLSADGQQLVLRDFRRQFGRIKDVTP